MVIVETDRGRVEVDDDDDDWENSTPIGTASHRVDRNGRVVEESAGGQKEQENGRKKWFA